MAKKKVRWTNYNKPRRPTKPQKMINGKNDLLYFKLDPDSLAISISEEDKEKLALADKVEVHEINYDYAYSYFHSCDSKSVDYIYIKFSTEKEIENPNYEQQLEEYNKKYAQYKEDLVSWKEWKAADDAKKRADQTAAELRTLEKLKKKYPDQFK